jgi:hypothetical protein
MPKINNSKNYEELTFSKIRCPKGHNGKIQLYQREGHHIKNLINKQKRLEDFTFLVDEIKLKDLNSNFISGFEEIYLAINYDEMLKGYKVNFNNLFGKNYWLDASFMIRDSMVNGKHPKYGDLKLVELSFLHSNNHGLNELDEKYSKIIKEIKKTKKDIKQELIRAIKNPQVYLTPQISEEMKQTKEYYYTLFKKHIKRKNFNWAKLLEKEYGCSKLIHKIIEKKVILNNPKRVIDVDLENRIFQHCKRIASRSKINTSNADNHLVSNAITKAIETNEQQIILTKDNGIYYLTRELSDLGRTLTHNKDYIPKLSLNNKYLNPTNLHILELTPEF